jgi:hypothetical protein
VTPGHGGMMWAEDPGCPLLPDLRGPSEDRSRPRACSGGRAGE